MTEPITAKIIVEFGEALPRTMSGLIRAMDEAQQHLDRRHYLPSGSYWVRTLPYEADKGHCRICDAGVLMATLADRLQIPIAGRAIYPSFFPSPISDALRALDAMRRGEWWAAAQWLDLSNGLDLDDEAWLEELPPPVHVNFLGWRQFALHRRSLLRRADRLEERGL